MKKNKILLVIGILIIGFLLYKPITQKEYKKQSGIYVQFRTTDLTYISGTAVGYTSTCGNSLTKYGKTNGACSDIYCDQTNQLLNVPTSTGTTKFWDRGNGVDVCICNPGIVTHTYALRYNTEDLDASKVDSSPNPITPSNELTCGTCDCTSGPCCDGCSYLLSESQPTAYTDTPLCISDKAYIHDYYCSGIDSLYHERDTLVEDCTIAGETCQDGVCVQSSTCPSTVCNDNIVTFDEYIAIGNKWLNG